MFTGWGLHALDTNALAGYLFELSFWRQNVFGSEETSILATATARTTHGPAQDSLDWSCGFVQVVAVQAETGLETEGITGTQTSGEDRGVIQEFGSDGDSRCSRHGNFKAVLASISASSNTTSIHTIQCGLGSCHEGHVFQIKASRKDFGDRGSSTGSLKSQQLHRVLQVFHRDIPSERCHLFFKVFHVTKLGGTIDYHVHIVSFLGNDGIIQNATIFVCDQTQTSLTRCQAVNIAQDDAFQECHTVLAVPFNLPHVTNIKQRRLSLRTTPQMFLHDTTILAALVQDRKFISRKGNHVTSEFLVQIV
mmetsp:Transcript_5459/g.8982  ORF Transcript_5459/g.8982 Transcript_5459/m.8982 type:complete len:307 (+) Transcript_5459:363-1283(+)